MILGLRTCVVYVRTEQLDAAKAWYASVVGVAPYFDTPFYVGFNVGGFELGLHPEGEPRPGGVAVYWGTPDIAAEVKRLVDLGRKWSATCKTWAKGSRWPPSRTRSVTTSA